MKSSILKELQRIELAIRGIDPLADIAELEAAQSDMQALIVALQAADSSMQSQISGNDSDISGHNSRISALEAMGGGGGIEGYIWAADEKPVSTQGGTFTSGAWRDRTLNTMETDLAGVTLASNVISGIPAGEYIVRLRCPAYDVQHHMAALVTSHGDYYASTAYTVTYAQSDSVLHRRVFFPSTATVRIRHSCRVSQSLNGFGTKTDLATEIYSQLLMLKTG